MNWAPIVAAIIVVESGGNDMAVNRREQAFGPMQIRQCVLDDVNARHGKDYKLRDCHSRMTSIRIFQAYVRMYRATDSYEHAARVWNGGPRGHHKAATLPYWRKVQKELERLQRKKGRLCACGKLRQTVCARCLPAGNCGASAGCAAAASLPLNDSPRSQRLWGRAENLPPRPGAVPVRAAFSPKEPR